MKQFQLKNILVVGQTGSGKSNFVERMIVDFLKERDPQELKLILIDPKKVQLMPFSGTAHLLIHIISKPKQAEGAFWWTWHEALRRKKVIEGAKANSIYDFNKHADIKGRLPEIILIIDELADLMIFDKDFFEEFMKKITDLSKVVGIYIIATTSRPSAEYVTTDAIRGCFPHRIGFRTLHEDSSDIVGKENLETLTDPGSCFVNDMEKGEIQRMQMPYISFEEVKEAVRSIKEKYGDFQMLSGEESDIEGEEKDVLYDEAKVILLENKCISIPLLQSKMRIGYNRSARIIEMLQDEGLVDEEAHYIPTQPTSKSIL